MAAQLVQEGTRMPVRPEPTAVSPIRRFELPDLSKHGGWILKRLKKARPDLDEKRIAGWLRGLLNSNESLFLYQEHGVALAQLSREDTLSGKPVVHERFVFVEQGYEESGAEFYVEFVRWAKSLGAETIIVEELTDVPHDLLKARIDKRVFERKQQYVRV